MVKYFNLLDSKPLSKQCIALGLTNFESVYEFVKQLPYGRNTNRSDYTLILKERKGTCSTKHAFLKAIALENNYEDLQLYMGIFKMNKENTSKISSILDAHKLDYIPEAHCYLKLNNVIKDITFNTNEAPIFAKTLVHEALITPEQIGDYKLKWHQAYLKSWLVNQNISLSYNDLWKVRELCIAQLSE
ncbi:hypothetical protein [Psychroserpens damuponensis]|uniref:hypothetical protein n=1 Tax=Psychroserpens damuponensis TaxID=943936 RepID=UPI00058BEAF2|nr:hypothetical protein [Psychroserpens damuponensis]